MGGIFRCLKGMWQMGSTRIIRQCFPKILSTIIETSCLHLLMSGKDRGPKQKSGLEINAKQQEYSNLDYLYITNLCTSLSALAEGGWRNFSLSILRFLHNCISWGASWELALQPKKAASKEHIKRLVRAAHLFQTKDHATRVIKRQRQFPDVLLHWVCTDVFYVCP